MKVFGATLVAAFCFSNIGIKAEEAVAKPFDAEEDMEENDDQENLVTDQQEITTEDDGKKEEDSGKDGKNIEEGKTYEYGGAKEEPEIVEPIDPKWKNFDASDEDSSDDDIPEEITAEEAEE